MFINISFQASQNAPPHVKVQIKALNDDEYIYVNPKQYLRILQRREKRRKLNIRSRFISVSNISEIGGKPKYIHESRHKHAMTRQRGKGGRFVGKKEDNTKSLKIENDES